MPPPFRFDIIAAAPPLLHTLNAEQMGMWILLVMELWRGGPLTGAQVVVLELERGIRSTEVTEQGKRSLSANLNNRTESERFLLEEVAPHQWSFAWLEAHRTKQTEKSDKAKASGKEGGRGNTPRRKAARAKANALKDGSTGTESERFSGGDGATTSPAQQGHEKRTLSEPMNGAESERFEEEPKGAHAHVGTRVSGSLFHEGVVEEEEGRARKNGAGQANEESDKSTTFARSAVATLEAFEAQMGKETALGIDVLHYFHAVKDWSAIQGRKKLRTADGWIATARTFMRGDMGKNGVKMKRTAEGVAADTANALEYLSLGK